MPLNIRKILMALSILFCVVVSTASEALRDPTEPPMQLRVKPDVGEDKRFKIHAVITSSDRHWVVINGHTLKVGDTIEGAKVMKIDRNSVQLLDGTTLIDIPIHLKIKEPVSDKQKESH